MHLDPVSRLELVRQEIDRTFGSGYAASHPELVTAALQAATLDWCAERLAAAIERVAISLEMVEEESAPNGLVRASGLELPTLDRR